MCGWLSRDLLAEGLVLIGQREPDRLAIETVGVVGLMRDALKLVGVAWETSVIRVDADIGLSLLNLELVLWEGTWR